MKFIDLKANLKTKIYPCYLLCGEDSFLYVNSINLIERQIFGDIHKNNLNKQEFDTENLDVNKFLDALNTMPFFAEKKLVVLKQIDDKLPNELIEEISSYLSNFCEQTVLVICAKDKLDSFKKIYSKVELVDCSRLNVDNVKIWINQKLNSIEINRNGQIISPTITPDALKLLLDYTNGYLSKISIEIEKLVSFSSGVITEDMVNQLVAKDLEYSVYELTDAIVQKNKDKAVIIKNDLMSNRKTFSTILNVCQSYFRRLFYSLTSSESEESIASMLKVKEYAVVKAKQQAKKIGAKTLKEIVELCAKLDYQIKTGEISLENATDYFMSYVLNI